jgi:hypothetical protein
MKLNNCDKLALDKEDALVDGDSSPFVNSHKNMHQVRDSSDKMIKYVFFLLLILIMTCSLV